MAMEKLKNYIGGEPVYVRGYWHVARIVEGEDMPDVTPYGFKDRKDAEDYIKNVIINRIDN